MDTLAHAVIGGLFFGNSGVRGVKHPTGIPFWKDWTVWAGAAFGAMPDLASFGVHTLTLAFNGGLRDIATRFGSGDVMAAAPPVETLPPYVLMNYQVMHSLVIAAVVGVLIYRFWRPAFLAFLAWPTHILCDIPVHSKSYFSTRFLWPLSEFSFDGWSFGKHLWIVALYWEVILAVLIWRMTKRPRREAVTVPEIPQAE